MKQQYYLLIVGIVIATILVGCVRNPTGKVISGLQSKTETYYLGGPKNINMLPIVADKLNYFDKYNLQIQRQDIQTGKMSMDALIKGDIDFGVLVETNIAFIGFQENPNIEIIAIIEEKTDDALVARKEIIIPKDFEGKKIGITKGTTSHAFVINFLKNNNINLSKVEFVNMPQPSIQAAVINGDIDAGSLWQPFRYNIEKVKKTDIKTFNDKNGYKAYAIITVRKDFAKNNPEVIEKFLKAVIDAELYYRQNPESVRNIISKELNIPIEVLNSVWDEYNLGISMKKELIETIKDEGKWVTELEEGFIGKAVPDYEDFININILKNIDESRVQWK